MTRVGKLSNGRKQVGSLGEHRDAVDDELEAPAPLILLPTQFDGAQASSLLSFVQFASSVTNAGLERIHVLRAVSGWIPQLRVSDAQRQADLVAAGIDRDIALDAIHRLAIRPDHINAHMQ